MEDWRLMDQESYLMGEKLEIINSSNIKNDHEHCEFCMKKISKSSSELIYTTLDRYRIICLNCFNDFNQKFNWEVLK